MSAASPRTPASDTLRANTALILGVVVGTALIVFDVLWWMDDHREPQITFLATPHAEIAVEMRGAIATPGVIYLPPGARMIDAINASGGLTVEADRPLINLSTRVNDGQVVVIPTMPSGDSRSETLININTASVTELTQLPGIGDVLANRIVEYRELNGPYQRIEDLLNITGISTSLLEEIGHLITVSSGD
ncbi:MAG: ComEA family DNA-binding protein [Thermomicrobiales bacterium]|nr:ComEA family DNA-binding protein [Thermomicrobiales bacterium]